MKHSIRTRLIIIFTSMIVFTILMCWCMNRFLLGGFYEKSKVAQMDDVYTQLNKIVKDVDWDDISSEEKEVLFNKIDGISANTGVSLYIFDVVDLGGYNVAITYRYPELTDRARNMNQSQLQKYVESALTGKSLDKNYKLLDKRQSYNLYKVFDERIGSNYIELFGNSSAKADNSSGVYMRTNYQSMQESAAVSNRLLMYVGLAVTWLGILIMVFVSNSYTRPILRLAAHAKRMSELDFGVRYDESREDEIGVLGHSMNVLSDKLEDTISELKTANNELKLDIERKQEQEEMRTEFLANVSHELKTPIALIQGYAEGLQDNITEDKESRDFYCEVIVDEANKMNKMVKKLLSLNQLEFGNGQVHMERFDMTEVIQSAVSASELMASQKNVKISFISPGPVYVWADEYMMDEVITNYVTNALNHVKGENIIEIKEMIQASGQVRVSVFNSGDPIPEKEVDKIWEKFYKVDKARTREYGGNGIGLSIVKAIMEAHNQNYGVRNYDNGVEFYFEADMKNEH